MTLLEAWATSAGAVKSGEVVAARTFAERVVEKALGTADSYRGSVAFQGVSTAAVVAVAAAEVVLPLQIDSAAVAVPVAATLPLEGRPLRSHRHPCVPNRRPSAVAAGFRASHGDPPNAAAVAAGSASPPDCAPAEWAHGVDAVAAAVGSAACGSWVAVVAVGGAAAVHRPPVGPPLVCVHSQCDAEVLYSAADAADGNQRQRPPLLLPRTATAELPLATGHLDTCHRHVIVDNVAALLVAGPEQRDSVAELPA